jgi:putative flippase GtrA
MMHVSFYERARIWVLAGWHRRAVTFKAAVYALVGVINTAVDYSVFLAAYVALGLPLIAANALSWMVAVSGSYVLNSTVTFAAESGRKLRWSAYFTFVAAGIAGWLANTAALLVAAEVLLLPVWLAKAGRNHGELCCELFIVTFCRVPRAPQSARDHLTRGAASRRPGR